MGIFVWGPQLLLAVLRALSAMEACIGLACALADRTVDKQHHPIFTPNTGPTDFSENDSSASEHGFLVLYTRAPSL